MISASAWSSRWAAGTAALLLAGGSALPGADREPPEPDPASGVDVPAEETPGPAEDPVEEVGPDGPLDGDPTDPPADEPPVEQPPAEEPPVVETPTEEPATENPVEDVPTEEPEQAGPVLVVVPEPVRSVVDGAPGYTLPLGNGGFTWLVDGVRVDELGAAARLSPDGGWYELSAVALGTDIERLVLAVVAAPGHALLAPDGTTSLIRSVLDPRAAAELAAPTALDGAGREDAVVVPDAATQVVRDPAGEVLDPGTHPVTAEYVDGVATITLTVTAADGHRLETDGTPVETVPGAGGTAEVLLVLTDVPPTAVEPAPAPEAAPSPAVPETTPGEPQEEAAEQLELSAPVLTVAAVVPEPTVAVAGAAEPEEADTLEALPESGPEGLGLMVMLGGLLLGGSWLVLGMRGD
ncbi:hypothetical protein M3148_09315 [Georgenia satyanarayanai]|uniref:hypothetical protein n=1 Tax=Georgenia satyanarayanai TaxID=860221 RepID=UPI002040D040|nr:hypothetical protein [Georgenia satyanarayanai]MCM3661186.1 hypothetical protein [Georgenia satyanarayanai]